MVDGQVDLCRVCSGNVEDSDQAIYCDLCHHWVHVVCDPMITISEYGHMIDCPTEEPWLCHMCRAENSDDNSDDNSDIQCRSGGLSCLCLNIRSVVSKRNEFLAYVLAHDPDLVAVTETFLDDSVHDSHIIPPGYVLFRKDRNRHGGGVMLLVRGSINVSRCVNYETSCELLWVKLSLKPMSMIFGVFYRPPYHSTHDLQALQDSLLSVSDKHSCIIVCGDFNVPNIDWATAAPTLTSPNASLLCNIVMDSFLTQMVTLPTRENNILDLVLTSHADLVTYVHLTDNLADCDHEVVEFLVAVTSPAIHERKRKLYNFKQANFEEFESLLSATPWDIIDYNGDVDMAWNLWKDLFLSAADQVIPKITWRKRKSKCWFSSNTITMIHRKRKLYRVKKKHPSPENLARYRRISNIVRLLTRQETKCHFASLCDTYRHNPKQFWKWVNSVRNFRDVIPPLVGGTGIISDDQEKANEFNSYFESVFTDEDVSHIDSLNLPNQGPPIHVDSIIFSSDSVFEELLKIDCSKACGPDLIPTILLKKGAVSICSSLAKLYTLSMEKGVLPRDWVTANVVPIHKNVINVLHQITVQSV